MAKEYNENIFFNLLLCTVGGEINHYKNAVNIREGAQTLINLRLYNLNSTLWKIIKCETKLIIKCETKINNKVWNKRNNK